MRRSLFSLGCFAMATLVLGSAVLFGSAAPAAAEVMAHYSFDTDYSESSGNWYDGVAYDGNYNGEGTALGDGDTDGVSITNAAGEWKFGDGAANFAQERDFVEIPTLSFADGEAYSIAFWARKADTTWDFFLGKHGESTNVIGRTNSSFKWRGNPASNTKDFTVADDQRQWHHYVVMAGDFDDADTAIDEVRLYIDGEVIGTADNLGTSLDLNAIGEGYAPSSNYDTYGQIDEVWIFNETLTDDEVKNLHDTNAVPEPSSLALALGCFVALGFGLRRSRRRR